MKETKEKIKFTDLIVRTNETNSEWFEVKFPFMSGAIKRGIGEKNYQEFKSFLDNLTK